MVKTDKLNKKPRVSVVIPCHNQGCFVDEAVDSVLGQTFTNFEIIVVNDGSSDAFTNRLLGNYSKPGVTVVETTNQGLAAARNNGIETSSGQYILPLDADDKLGETYLEKAVGILDTHPEVGIVYCKACTFGNEEIDWELPDFSLDEMLMDNIIFCSAMFRRRDWQRVGGYDPDMVFGWEDYDFWLSLIERNIGVHRIPETLFYYRVTSSSMVRTKSRKQKVEMFVNVFHKHRNLFENNIDVWINKFLETQKTVREKVRRTKELESQIVQKDKHNRQMEDKIGYLEEHISHREKHLKHLEDELHHIKTSKEWRLAFRFARFFWKILSWIPQAKGKSI